MRKSVLVILLMLGFAAGCGRKPEEAIKEKAAEKILEKIISTGNDGKAEVDISDESMSIKTADGNFNISGGDAAKIPDDFSEDVYLLEGGQLVAVMTVLGSSSVSFTCSSTPTESAALYKEKMTELGWALQQSMDMGAQQILMFSKDTRMATVALGLAEGSTFVNLTLAEQ